ncbi:MAG: peroxiredoxin [Pseudomonadales bacterium]|nr:peroxiredoxin [Candidatus Woesebacteria bacterium]MCB9801300.1 peroxiredoxin [Pseudomonadales bacterium]
MITKNSQAPLTIKVVDESGNLISLEDTLGTYVLLFVYPKDNTPGCTTEACSFRDSYAKLKKMGVRVIGLSGDSLASHEKFKSKHSLTFELWSDPEKKLIKALGALKEKSMFGNTFLGIVRSSFAIDPEGKIVQIWPKVSPNTHVSEVISYFTQLLEG